MVAEVKTSYLGEYFSAVAGVATLTMLLFIFSDGLLVTIFDLSKPETAQSRVNKQTQDEKVI